MAKTNVVPLVRENGREKSEEVKTGIVLYIHVICFDLKVDSARQERYTTHWYY